VSIRHAIASSAASVLWLLLCACDDGRNAASLGPTGDTERSTAPAQTFTLSGTVRQSVTSDAVPNVRVEVIDGANAGRAATSDAAGRYELPGLAGGMLRVRASRNGYASAEQALRLVAHAAVNFTMVQGPACALSGTVRESPGDALSIGALVKLVKEPGGSSASSIVSTTTSAGGRYRLEGIDCGVSHWLRVEKEDFFSTEAAVRIAGETQRDVTISRVTYPLRGFVREAPSGTPLVDATVEVVTGPYAGQKDATRADGSYFLQVRDDVTVRASKAGYVPEEATVMVASPSAYREFFLTRQPSAR
jgi:hypothetical protein